MEWLRLGLDILDDLGRFAPDGKSITQMSVRDLKAHMPMESALKVTKAILKASGRDLLDFDFSRAEVMRASDCELQSVEDLFGEEPMYGESIDESVISVLGEGFVGELRRLKRDLEEEEEWKKARKILGLAGDELLIYASFLKSVGEKECARKMLGPFISRTPAGFLKTRDFFARVLNVLRKLPPIGDGAYDVETRPGIGNFKVGEAYLFPSFAVGVKIDGNDKMSKGKGTVLRISGKTNRGHGMAYYKLGGKESICSHTHFLFTCLFASDKFIFEPGTTFKVEEVEEGESCCVVYCEFVECGKPSAFKDTVGEFEGGSLEENDKNTSHSTSSGPRYADPSPPSLSDILKLGDSCKAVSLEDAIRKAGFASSEKFIAEAKEKKMKDLRRIAKDFDLTEEDVISVFIYTLENKEDRPKSPYNIVNSALANRTEEGLLPLREYIFYLLQGLRSLPRFKKQSVLYRGVKMAQSVSKRIYREGRTLTWTSFTSTTTDENRAYKFSGDNGVVFEIHGKFRGYSIGLFSKFASEEGNSKNGEA